MDLRMFHFDISTHENTGRKEHIQNIDSHSTNTALCGYTHMLLSSNGDTITLDWARQNIIPSAAIGSVCKKCAKKAMEMLSWKDENILHLLINNRDIFVYDASFLYENVEAKQSIIKKISDSWYSEMDTIEIIVNKKKYKFYWDSQYSKDLLA